MNTSGNTETHIRLCNNKDVYITGKITVRIQMQKGDVK